MSAATFTARCGSCSQHERVAELEGLLREAHGVLSTLRPAFHPEYLDRIERAMDPDRLTFAERGAVNYLRLAQAPEVPRRWGEPERELYPCDEHCLDDRGTCRYGRNNDHHEPCRNDDHSGCPPIRTEDGAE